MIEDDLFAIVDAALEPLGATPEDGEEFRTPPLDVLRYYRRAVRLHAIPWLGRAWSVVAVVRQPMDVGLKIGGGLRDPDDPARPRRRPRGSRPAATAAGDARPDRARPHARADRPGRGRRRCRRC